MSARDNLIEALNEEHNPAYWSDEVRDSEGLVNAYARELAHELAEKIREFTHTPVGDLSRDLGIEDGLEKAADLIDPEEKE